MTTWNDYRSVLANLRDLIDLQQQVGRRTAEVQQKTFGHDVERLSDQDRAELHRNARGQDSVTTALERALAELEQLQAKLRRSEPDDARALSEAERKLAGNDPANLSDPQEPDVSVEGRMEVFEDSIEKLLGLKPRRGFDSIIRTTVRLGLEVPDDPPDALSEVLNRKYSPRKYSTAGTAAISSIRLKVNPNVLAK